MTREGLYDVTIVESDESYAGRLSEELAHAGPLSFRVHRFGGVEEAMSHLLNEPTDVIVFDPPADGGLDTLARMHSKFPEMPVVALAASAADAVAREAVHRGALDCLVKTELAAGALARVLVSAIERQYAQNLLADLSLIDPMTGLFNRKGFFILVEQRLRLGRRSGRPMKIVFVDIDGLREINRSHGHAEGDRALKSLAGAMKTVLRGADTLARFGPDEFVGAVEDCDDREIAAILGRIRSNVARLNRGPAAYRFSASAAAAAFDPAAPKPLPALVDEARQAVHAEKEKKKEPSAGARPTGASARAARKRKRILLIDDDESILQILGKRFESSGYDVLTAKDGREGLEAAREGWPDLVILDLRLPGYSGEEICKAIREDGDKEFARTPILMLTGKTADVDRVLGMVIGASAYLTKPFRTQDLMRHVRKLAGEMQP